MRGIHTLLIITALFALALLGAYIAFNLLKGTARIRNKSVQLGGAAAGFVVFFWLLMKYYDPLLKELEPAPVEAQEITTFVGGRREVLDTVSLSFKTQLISDRDFQALDRNSYVILSERPGIAIARPPTRSWEAGQFDSLSTISYNDLPIAQVGQPLSDAFGITPRSRRVYGARKLPGVKITLEANSRIGETAVGHNPFRDTSFSRRIIEAMLAPALKEEGHVAQEKVQLFQESLLSTSDSLIRAKVPIAKEIYTGVFVIPYDTAAIDPRTAVAAFRPTVFEHLIGTINVGGSAGSGVGKVYVNYDERVASFNLSTYLFDVLVNGRRTDLILNAIVFAVGQENSGSWLSFSTQLLSQPRCSSS